MTLFSGTLAMNPFQGPQINALTGGRSIPFWIPTPQETELLTSGFTGEGPTYCEDWDTLWLNGKQMPGLCSVKCEAQLQVDQKKGQGYDGATLTLGGYVPGPIDIAVTIWTKDQWEVFVDLLSGFWRRPGKNSAELERLARDNKISAAAAKTFQEAVYVIHPALSMLNVSMLIVRGISVPEPGPALQSKTIRLRCIEYRRPTGPAPSKVKEGKRNNVPADKQVVPPHEAHVGPNGLSSE